MTTRMGAHTTNPSPQRNDVIELYTGTMNIFPAKVRIVLAEKGIDFQPRWVPWKKATGYDMPDAVLTVNPLGQLPVLVDDGFVVYDSTIVCEYLEERFPKPALYPAELQAKTRCRQLENEGDLYLFAHVARFYPDERIPEVMKSAQRALDEAFVRLDGFLDGREYLCGDFSIADIATYLPLAFGRSLGVQIDSRNTHLHAWRERMSERDTIREVLTAVAENVSAQGVLSDE